ncbi:hypothetical protein H4V99_001026 [Cryobacterium sp. CG_9.6]|nr:hypothetical protein [Cryobacterium sp. CG_9.6]
MADAKRANIDPAVVTNKRTIETITALLDGTRRSDDPQGEAYALLLAEYCRHWNRSMPFMFEREGDYTELLIPANLLADDSVLARAVTVLTEDVCQDVEVIGWLYQFYISERKDEVIAGFKKNKKAGAAEIPAATQLFTPHWIVRYLVENTVGRLWLLNRPSSRIAEQMVYYIKPVDEESDFVKIATPEELKIIDPAAGSGHMLTYAFDLLYAIYEEEGYAPADIPELILRHNLYGAEIDPRSGALAAFALAMKARAKQRTFLAKGTQPNICSLEAIRFDQAELDFLWSLTGGANISRAGADEFWLTFEHADTFGSLIRPNGALEGQVRAAIETADSDDLLTGPTVTKAAKVLAQAAYLLRQYGVVIANPPYMGIGNMGEQLTAWVKQNYPDERQDLYGCFVAAGISLASSGAVVGMITGDTWLSIKSFEGLRVRLLTRARLEALVHIHDVSNHSDIFGANTAFVVTVGARASARTVFIHLSDLSQELKKQKLLAAQRDQGVPWRYDVDASIFQALPGTVLAFRLPGKLQESFAAGVLLGDRYSAMNGMTTGENARFLRLWYEVSADRTMLDAADAAEALVSGVRWFPYNKGGGYRKWYGNAEYLINWEDDGRDVIGNGRAFTRGRKYYFRPMVSWGKVSSGAPSFRYYPPGFLFDVAGTAMFREPEVELLDALSFCNSVVAQHFLAALSPTLNYESGQISSLPLLPGPKERRREIARQLVAIAKADWDSDETAWGFERPSLLGGVLPTELRSAFRIAEESSRATTSVVQTLEEENNALLITDYGIDGDVPPDVASDRIALRGNAVNRFGAGRTESQYSELATAARVSDLISYAVGCMLGRFSLDEPGLILANQGDTLRNYVAKVAIPSFLPDKDNVIPIVDGDWFEDDIVARFRQFLRIAFGEQHFEENLRFVTESLGVKDLRDYFVKSFYKDHVQRYKKRPIYWLFSSPMGSFNALIYMHRYTPSTVSTVLNEYLREFKAKLEASRQHQERLALGTGAPREKAAAQKEVDRMRKVLLELDEYEHDVLYPLATQQLAIDLDDGVLVNYLRFGGALAPIPEIEKKRAEVESWSWPQHQRRGEVDHG